MVRFLYRQAFWTAMLVVWITISVTAAEASAPPLVGEDVVFAEKNGLVSVEAEHYFEQTATQRRAFHLTTVEHTPEVQADADPPHVAGASGGAYLEVLPDTRASHDDKLVRGENFADAPGTQAVLHYKVHFATPGKYYVWARIFSTGTEDNGVHVGIDGEWPESGRRMQWTAKRKWFWDSKQRTAKVHGGVPGQLYLTVDEPGEHVIMFSMREDGFEFDKWLMTTDRDFKRPTGAGPKSQLHAGELPPSFEEVPAADHDATAAAQPAEGGTPQSQPKGADGDGSVSIAGELKRWHNVTLTLDGPFATEGDQAPNPFLDYRMTVAFKHSSGTPSYNVPGYFAADGDAANTSATSGTQWRAHLSPDLQGTWQYRVSFVRGEQAAIDDRADAKPVKPFDGVSGEFEIAPSDKQGRDWRAQGRLEYIGKRYLRSAGTNQYFLKAGADSPETLLGYVDFDGTVAGKPGKVPLKTWQPHVRDWKPGDPTWKDGKGKGLIGAVNYLSGKGANAFSFLTYNAGGDGDNVWPFVERSDKLHYDCSKLDQWGMVFEHGTNKGMYLHFKLQETENDDNRRGEGDKVGKVPVSLDGGHLGPERKLYFRELIARFAHNLALNWNLGEENTQSTDEQQAMLDYIAATDPYGHHRVLHTFPPQQNKKYRPLLGDKSELTGVSVQNSHIRDTHAQTVKWVRESTEAGKPWVVAFDESGSAAHGSRPDWGYQGFDGRDSDGKQVGDEHDVRSLTLWGNLMGGGGGVEYYFGYKLAENDLVCEDWRSRDRTWDYSRIALEFFAEHEIPFWRMDNHDELAGNPEHGNWRYCLACPGEIYLVYLPKAGKVELDLTDEEGSYTVAWFRPRVGGELQTGSVANVAGGGAANLGRPPAEGDGDWLAVVRKQQLRNNPLTIDGHPMYGADPSVVIADDGRLYLFPTTDNRDWNKQFGWSCYSTTDLVHWTDHGVVFDRDDSRWGTKKAWAPDIVKRDGKYYLYYYFNVGQPHGGVGVAVADSPEGPFEEALGKPLLRGHDPAVLVDDEGQAYLYVQDQVSVLGSDMTSIQRGPIDLDLEYRPEKFEAAYVFKRGGLYYFTIARDWNNLIYYTGESPLGPFEFRGEIMSAYGGNNHHPIVEYKGQWLLFYHEWVEGSADHQRQLRAEVLHFDETGAIEPVEPTAAGVDFRSQRRFHFCIRLPATLLEPTMHRAVGVVAALCLLPTLGVVAQERPNFLFVAVDDLNAFSRFAAEEPGNFLQTIYPDEQARSRIGERLTPNLDSFASKSAPFLRAYCPSALCGPSRTSLLKGVPPHVSGYYMHQRHFRLYDSLKNAVTLPQQLKASGYYTTGLGKIFHTPQGTVDGPLKDDWADARNSWSQWVNHPVGCGGGRPSKYSPPDGGLMQFGPSRLATEESEDWLAATFAAELLEQGTATTRSAGRKSRGEQQVRLPDNQPYFLACGLFRPHLPFFAPKEFFEKFPTEEMKGLNRESLDRIIADLEDLPAGAMRFSDYDRGKMRTVMDHARKLGGEEAEVEAWRAVVQSYLACVCYADTCLGRIFKGLDASPQKDNTVVLLWSDHGYHLGSKYHIAKQALWEEANRVQFIIRDPRNPASCDGQPRRQIVSLNDLYPTICGMAEVPLPANVICGEDLAPLLDSQDAPEVHDVLLMTYMEGNHGLRSPQHRFMRYRDGSNEMYDMLQDPSQLENIAGSTGSSNVESQMNHQLDRLLERKLDAAAVDTTAGVTQ